MAPAAPAQLQTRIRALTPVRAAAWADLALNASAPSVVGIALREGAVEVRGAVTAVWHKAALVDSNDRLGRGLARESGFEGRVRGLVCSPRDPGKRLFKI